jgi:two-component system LytT family response regulator
MIRAIIIDDEVHCQKTLSILLKEYCPAIEVVQLCGDGQSGLEAIHHVKPDLVFLDIEMPQMNGFEMLAQLQETPFAIIFTTSYDQYAIKAFRFSALDYLLKPIEPKELIAAVQKVAAQRSLPAQEQFELLLKQIHHKGNEFSKIAVPTAEGFELIPAEHVVRCEANGNYTTFFLKNKQKIVACRSLGEIEEQLQDFSFFVRVHHSWIANLNEVTKYIRGEGGYLLMSDGSTVNVARSRKDMLLKLF